MHGMKTPQDEKPKRGRPGVEVKGKLRSVDVSMDDVSIARAKALGDGNQSLGVRRALRLAAQSKRWEFER
jgi:hypothetical protein